MYSSNAADLLTVNETAADPPKEDPVPVPGAAGPPPKDMNSRRNLALEATYVQHNFSQQVLSKYAILEILFLLWFFFFFDLYIL